MIRTCVVAKLPQRSLETFIAAHVDRLPAAVLLHRGGGDFPLVVQTPGSASDGASLLEATERDAVERRIAAGEDPTPAYAAALARWLAVTRPDVVLAEYGPHGVLVHGPCAAAGIPLVVHFHGYDVHRRDRVEPLAAAYRTLLADAAAIVAVSRDMVEALVALGAARARVTLNPCGADIELFHGAKPARAMPLFVGVGRFVEKKGQVRTIAAFRRTLDVVPEARLVLVGDGEDLERCRALANELGLAAAVSFPGRLTPCEIASLLREARCFVQHSLRAASGDAEGTPVAVLEAGASGLPVVATRHEGIRDVVREEETGLLVDERDVAAMGAAMIRIARDPELAARLGEAARRHVAASHSLAGSIERLRAVLAFAARARS